VPDFRYALRTLRKQPVFSISAILTLALGIGANTAMFSVFDAVVLHPLPYRDSKHLVLVWQTLPTRPQNPVLTLNYVAWTRQAHSFSTLLAMSTRFMAFRNGGESRQLLGARVSRGFFSELGVLPRIGREFLPAEHDLGHEHVAILSHKLWQSEFAADPRALGRTFTLNGESYTVVGVAPPNFDESLVMRGVEIWCPLALGPGVDLRRNNMAVIGRLQPSVSLEAANREMKVIAARLADQYPDLNRGWSASVTPLENYETEKLGPTVAALLTGVGMVLLIACVNVANLLLARSDARAKESAVRAALGASRGRLLGQLLTETTILAILGSVAGVALAYAGLKTIIALNAVKLPGLENAGLNGRVLAFTAAAAVFTGLLFGLLPARHLLGGDLSRTLRESGRGAVSPRRGRGSRNLFVISEIALSLVLLAGAAMMARSLLWLQTENRGFVSDHLLSFRATFPSSEFATSVSMEAYYESLLGRLKQLPGVRAVGANTNLPLDSFMLVGVFFQPPGAPPAAGSDRPIAECNLVSPGFLRALGIPLVEGREFDERDRRGSPPVVIISSTLARLYFPGQNPVGRRLTVAIPAPGNPDVADEIVGVAGDIHYLTRPAIESLEIYLPYAQITWPNIYVMARTTGDPAAVVPSLHALLREPAFGRQSTAELMTMQERISVLNDKPRLNSLLAVLFAAIALLLAGVGIYGVVSYSTMQRAQEIGVRMALGATPRDIVGWVLKHALILIVIGIALGALGMLALSRAIASFLYGAHSAGGWPLAFAALVLALVALLASYIPARRAVRGDPVSALRSE